MTATTPMGRMRAAPDGRAASLAAVIFGVIVLVAMTSAAGAMISSAVHRNDKEDGARKASGIALMVSVFTAGVATFPLAVCALHTYVAGYRQK